MRLVSGCATTRRVSCWIKTAEKGKKLTALDANIMQGNSVVAEPSPLEAWRARFPEVFQAGGFDVAIGNPPYVRQEWIKEDKPFLERHYRAFDGVAAHENVNRSSPAATASPSAARSLSKSILPSANTSGKLPQLGHALRVRIGGREGNGQLVAARGHGVLSVLVVNNWLGELV